LYTKDPLNPISLNYSRRMTSVVEAREGDRVTCPVCGELAKLMDICSTWPKPYIAWISCEGCGSAGKRRLHRIVTPPIYMDSIKIRVPKEKQGQQEFEFIEDEYLWRKYS
jgi:transcription elongation factor Elf1